MPDCPYIPLYYLDKITDNYIEDPHAFIISIILISIKWAEDDVPKNKFVARMCGFLLETFNNYERMVLKLLNFNLFLSNEEYLQYISKNLIVIT